MLALARALMSRPQLLLLDEPSMGLAPVMVDKIFEVIGQIVQQKISVLLVEQNAHRALQTADQAYVMESGEITLSGPAHTLLNSEKIQAAYLGA
jgi:branched-chain amino acid transport system ATP-binding protein